MGRGHNHKTFCSVEHIPFADDITGTIEAFAVGKGLNADSYYHDLPVWIVNEQPPTNRMRRLQVTAYIVSDNVFLSLVPSGN